MIRAKIYNEIKRLTKLYAMDSTITVPVFKKDIIIRWSNKSYKLGSVKFCTKFIYTFYSIYEMQYTENTLIIYNVKNKKAFLKELKKL